jgi:L-fucose isomerase-like protein
MEVELAGYIPVTEIIIPDTLQQALPHIQAVLQEHRHQAVLAEAQHTLTQVNMGLEFRGKASEEVIPLEVLHTVAAAAEALAELAEQAVEIPQVQVA